MAPVACGTGGTRAGWYAGRVADRVVRGPDGTRAWWYAGRVVRAPGVKRCLLAQVEGTRAAWYVGLKLRRPDGTLLYSLHDVFSALFSAYMYDVCMLPLDTCVYSLRWDNANTCSFYRQFLTPHSSARVLQNGETLSVSSI